MFCPVKIITAILNKSAHGCIEVATKDYQNKNKKNNNQWFLHEDNV